MTKSNNQMTHIRELEVEESQNIMYMYLYFINKFLYSRKYGLLNQFIYLLSYLMILYV